MVNDLPKGLLVLIAIKNCQCKACVTEAPWSTDSVQVIFEIWDYFPILSLNRYIKIDHKLDLMHVETSWQEICCDNCVHFSSAEVLNVLISLLYRHSSENKSYFLPNIFELFMENLTRR